MTIHAYSPRLEWVGQYRLDEATGIVRREVRPGRNELTEQLIAEGALEHVLERFSLAREARFRAASGILRSIPAYGGAHP